MKLSIATLLFLPATVTAFMPTQPRTFISTSLSAAKTKEEDIELTRKVIASFMDDAEESQPAKAEESEPADDSSKDE